VLSRLPPKARKQIISEIKASDSKLATLINIYNTKVEELGLGVDKKLAVFVLDEDRLEELVESSDFDKVVKEGKVRFLGLSEAAPNTIRKANKVHKNRCIAN
jgi:aryl-alcohol dehydrogenase-like predicted oxidoreductase